MKISEKTCAHIPYMKNTQAMGKKSPGLIHFFSDQVFFKQDETTERLMRKHQ